MLHIYRRSDDALTLKPDLIILMLGGGDMHIDFDPAELANRDNPAFKPGPISSAVQGRLGRLKATLLEDSRALLMAKHFGYQNPALTMRSIALRPGDADYMVAPPTEAWKRHLADLDLLMGDMARKFHAHGVPFALLTNIGEPQAVLLSSNISLPGFDPREFGRNLARIASAHVIPMLDVEDDFSRVPYTRLFYTADGHANAEGHAAISRGLARELLAHGLVPDCKAR